MEDKYDETYLEEMGIDKVVELLDDSLGRIKKISTMIKNKENIDEETKGNVIELYDSVNMIYDFEMSKELNEQKKNGKKFLSDDDVDNLIIKIIKE